MNACREEGFALGEKRGKERGESIILNMSGKGKTPEEIADMTGKNLEEILKIQQKDLQVEDENKN